MKCKVCGSEWSTDAKKSKSIMECPFCGADLNESKNINEKDVVSVMKYIAAEYGIDLLSQKNRFLAMFRDLAPSLQREHKLLKRVYEEDLAKILFNCDPKNDEEKKQAVYLFKNKLATEAILPERECAEITGWFTQTLGWSVSIDEPEKNKDTEKTSGRPVKEPISKSAAPKQAQTESQPKATTKKPTTSNVEANEIKNVYAIGTTQRNEFWPKGEMSSVFDRDKYNAISFQIIMEKTFTFNQDAVMSFQVYDSSNNLITNIHNPIKVNSGYNKFAQMFIIVGTDGTKVQTGSYRAVFQINNSKRYEYNFSISETQSTKTPMREPTPVVTTPPSGDVKKPRRVGIYVVFMILFGTLGVHSFYARKYLKGFTQLGLFIAGVCNVVPAAVALYIWVFIDLIKVIVQRRVP